MPKTGNVDAGRSWRLGLALLMAGLLAVYLITLAPGLTWANQGADGGDFITAAAVGGVAHPTGYPTYLLLARLFQQLPVGSLAYRTNLLSALCAALAAGLTAGLTRRYLGPAQYAGLASLTAGLAFGLAPMLWSQAVITEVYALHTLGAALALFSLTGEAGAARDIRTGALLGLALGNHLTAVFLLPVCLGVTGWRDGRWQFRALARLAAGLGLGLLVYLYLPLSARARPPINWGGASTWDGLWWLISGRPYQGLAFGAPLPDAVTRAPAWAGLLVAQFGWAGMLLGFYGLFFGQAVAPRVKVLTLWLFGAHTVFAIGYASRDSLMYLLPAWLAFAVWFGLGLAEALAQLRQRHVFWPAALAGVVGLSVLVNAGLHWREVDASRDARAEVFGQAVMREAPPAALVFAREDRDSFAMWYFHFALRQRPDLRVVVEPLLVFAWYRESLQAAYADLALPSQAPGGWRAAVIDANLQRPVCDANPDDPPFVLCLSAEAP